MEIKSINKYSGWYASYMSDLQGRCLVEAMTKKIEHQELLINRIIGEIELCDDPREESPETIINSIKELIGNVELIHHSVGYFTWVD